MIKTSNKILMLFLIVILTSGCAEREGTTTSSVLMTSIVEPQENVVETLEKLGYDVYGFDEGYDSVLGKRMLVAMSIKNQSEQIREAFILMYGKNKTMDHYVVELRVEENIALFLAKKDDLEAFAKNEIDETEFQKRNLKTVTEFYRKLNKTQDFEIYIV